MAIQMLLEMAGKEQTERHDAITPRTDSDISRASSGAGDDRGSRGSFGF
jgi:uncharacterized membrane protein